MEILQGQLREYANDLARYFLKVQLKEKSRGRNHDLSVVEYKLQQESEKATELEMKVAKQQQVNRDLCQKHDRLEKESTKLEFESFKKKMVMKEIEEEYEEAKETLSKTDKLMEILGQVKRFILSYLPFAPLMEKFANKVEAGEKVIYAGNSYTGEMTSLGELMDSFKEKFQEHFCWFPRLMRWKTSKGEVAPVYKDVSDDGYEYELKGYANVESKAAYRVKDVQGEIKAESRVGTLEQIEACVEVAEKEIGLIQQERKKGR